MASESGDLTQSRLHRHNGGITSERLVRKAISLVSSRMLPHGEADTWTGILRESLTIAGWVAMWRPMQIYLYDWWPLRRRGRLYTKLSGMPVEVVHKGGGKTEESQSENNPIAA